MLVIDRIPQRKFIELELSQGFYNILPSTTMNATLELHSQCHTGYLGVDSSDKWIMHLFLDKLSVLMFYADKRGLSVECFSCLGGSQFTILIQWKELGLNPDAIPERLLKDYLSLIKNKLMSTFLPLILTRANKIRKIILLAVKEIQAPQKQWSPVLGTSIIEEKGFYHIYRGTQIRRKGLDIRGLTLDLIM